MNPDEAVARARLLAAGGGRRILGVAGCPGGGKSTIAARIVEALGPELAALVPMDGFHLANEVLIAAGTRDRKGAPFTFDASGYVALLQRLRTASPGETVFAPRFDRGLGEGIAGAIAVAADVPLVITEGNYLLLDDGPWVGVRPLLDECWFVDVPDEIRLPRLIARHIHFGKTPQAAEAWVMRSDEPNAELVKASAHRADAVVILD